MEEGAAGVAGFVACRTHVQDPYGVAAPSNLPFGALESRGLVLLKAYGFPVVVPDQQRKAAVEEGDPVLFQGHRVASAVETAVMGCGQDVGRGRSDLVEAFVEDLPVFVSLRHCCFRSCSLFLSLQLRPI